MKLSECPEFRKLQGLASLQLISELRQHRNSRLKLSDMPLLHYRYNVHDASPHLGMLNMLIGVSVIFCLWNVWAAPPLTTTTLQSSSTMDTPTNSNTMYEVNSINQQETKQHFDTEMMRLASALSLPTLAPIESLNQQTLHLLPIHTASNGQKYILLTGQDLQSRTIPSKQDEVYEKRLQISDTKYSIRTQDEMRNGGKATHTSNSRKRAPKQLVPSTRRELSTPLFVDSVTYEPFSSTSSSLTTAYHYRPNWTSWVYGIAISCSILAGGLFARISLQRMDRWEHLSKEDSLAFDVAYTSYIDDHGSFFTVSDWSGDHLDRFDV